MSNTLIVSSKNIVDKVNNSTFMIKFDKQVNFTNKEIAFVSASMYYSWRNINSTNNKLSYEWVGNTYNIELPIGFYEISDINSYCQFIFRINGHYLVNTITTTNVYYIDIVINQTNYSCDIITYPIPSTLPSGYTNPNSFTFATKNSQHPNVTLTSKINEIMGFDTNFSTYTISNPRSVTYQSTNPPNLNPNSSLLLVCDQAFNELSNLGILYSIVPSGRVGSLFVDRPNHPIYLKMKDGLYDRLTFRLLDANTFLPVEIVDPETNLLFSIKNKGS